MIYYLQGFAAASIFSLIYYIVPAWFASAAYHVLQDPYSEMAMILLFPILLSALLPVIPIQNLLSLPPFKYIPLYFQHREINELSDEQMIELIKTKPTLICLHPHGIFSFVSLCSAVEWSKSWYNPRKTVTAVASSVINTPILKHVLGIFGIISASADSLVQSLKDEENRGVILFPGGTAELFLTNHERERLFILERKGFIKIALTQGCAVIPGYLFGNTRVLKLLDWSWLQAFSRKTGIAITYFYGKFYLPLPMPYPSLCVLGAPIHLPKIESPSQSDIDHWHAVYVSEVKRIFDKYKSEAKGYENTELEIE